MKRIAGSLATAALGLALAASALAAGSGGRAGAKASSGGGACRPGAGGPIPAWAQQAPDPEDADRLAVERAAWARMLRAHVRIGLVDYAAWRERDRATLRRYLAAMTATSRSLYCSWSEKERIAFWIDLYNSTAVDAVLEGYPVASIRDVGRVPFAVFRQERISLPNLLGRSVSLDFVEKVILLPEFRDPRVHAALVCASRSCPALRAEPYDGTSLDEQLDSAVRAFVSDPARNRWDPVSRTLSLSKIFDWYAADFGGAEGVRAWGARYLPANVAAAVRSGASIEFREYDWALNDVPRTSRAAR